MLDRYPSRGRQVRDFGWSDYFARLRLTKSYRPLPDLGTTPRAVDRRSKAVSNLAPVDDRYRIFTNYLDQQRDLGAHRARIMRLTTNSSGAMDGHYLLLLVSKDLRYSTMADHLRLGFDSELWEGRQAIFCEKWIISHVRVHSIKTNERRLLAKFDVIPIRGLYGKEGPATSIGAIWDYLFIDEHIWLEKGYCRWRLFFESQVMDKVLSIASSFPADAKFEPYDIYYQALVQPLKQAEKRLCDDSEESSTPTREPDEQTANDFAQSWVAIEQFFEQRLQPSASKDYLLHFVTQLRRDGYDRKLRAGRSLFAFTLSRSRRYGLRPDQTWIALRFHDNVTPLSCRVLGGKYSP